MQALHQRVATRLSELERKIISGESTQSTVSQLHVHVPPLYIHGTARLYILCPLPFTPSSPSSQMHNEQVKKQLETDNLQHSLDIEKGQLEQQKRVY